MLFEGGAALLDHAVFLRAGLIAADQEAASLVDWYANGEGRPLISGFLANGRAVFTV